MLHRVPGTHSVPHKHQAAALVLITLPSLASALSTRLPWPGVLGAGEVSVSVTSAEPTMLPPSVLFYSVPAPPAAYLLYLARLAAFSW